MRCRAHQCPEDDLEGERAFCEIHWMLLCQRLYSDGRSMAEWLCSAYGSEHWRFALEACVRAVRAIEAERATPPW